MYEKELDHVLHNLSIAWLLSDDYYIILQVASIVHSSIQPLHMLSLLVHSF